MSNGYIPIFLRHTQSVKIRTSPLTERSRNYKNPQHSVNDRSKTAKVAEQKLHKYQLRNPYIKFPNVKRRKSAASVNDSKRRTLPADMIRNAHNSPAHKTLAKKHQSRTYHSSTMPNPTMTIQGSRLLRETRQVDAEQRANGQLVGAHSVPYQRASRDRPPAVVPHTMTSSTISKKECRALCRNRVRVREPRRQSQ
jgi:hypothetical protein